MAANPYKESMSFGRRVGAHVAVAERVLGHRLPEGATVHHVNEDKHDNRPENLVVCPSEAYHQWLHKRMRAFAATGDANALRCQQCGTYTDQYDIVVKQSGKRQVSTHRACLRRAWSEKYYRQKARDGYVRGPYRKAV